MSKEKWITFVIVLNVIVIGTIIGVSLFQPEKHGQVVSLDVKKEELKGKLTKDTRDFSNKDVLEKKKSEPEAKKIEKKPTPVVISEKKEESSVKLPRGSWSASDKVITERPEPKPEAKKVEKKPTPVVSTKKEEEPAVKLPRGSWSTSNKVVPEVEKTEPEAKKIEKVAKGKEIVTEKTPKVNIYGILTDTYTDPSLKFDITNPGNEDGGYLGVWGPTKATANIFDGHSDPPNILKVSCRGKWGGIWFQFGYNPKSPPGQVVNTDMSLYGGYIKFDIKTDGELIVGMEWWDDIEDEKDSMEKKINEDLNVPTDNNWHSVEIDINKLVGKEFKRSVNFEKIRLPISFYGENVTFYIDNIRWEK